MLLAQSITANHHLPENEGSGALAKTALKDRIPVVALQILTEILSTQHEDGTWGSNGHVEETIQYPALTLLELASLPYTAVLRTEIQDAISKAREALSTRQNAISNGTQTHLLSIPDIHPDAVEECRQNAQAKQAQKINGFVTYFSSLDHIKNLQLVRIKASILEASLYRPFLQAARGDIFPPSTSKEQDKYLDYIPIMWLLASASYRVFVPPEYLLDMMILSMWIFLADEYMESRIVKLALTEFRQFRKYVEEDLYTGVPPEQTSRDNTTAVLQEARSVFTAFATAVLSYPSLASASATDLLDLRFETKNYLLHHLDQLEDNLRLVQQPTSQNPTGEKTIRKKFLTPRTSFQTWIHTTAAGHISGPFAWAFFTCCMSSSLSSLHETQTPGKKVKKDCFCTPRQKLMAHGLNAHYGAFCRLYNDYGSVARDAAEGNLNSVNFPEFFPSSSSSSPPFEEEEEQHETSTPSSKADDEEKKAKSLLLSAARYERSCALTTMETLCRELEDGCPEEPRAGAGEIQRGKEKEKGKGKKWLADRIRVYVGAGEQFSDMYLTRDVTNGVK
ncbi:MAG: hypothetical protein LQ345_001435 [Seirophora villosa]|nr:MAG: hypothetical protein LQ345_001435 [Seirophora villosa]